MKICSICNLTSPIAATYCIECGALFQANTGVTYKLDTKPPAVYYEDCGPYIPLRRDEVIPEMSGARLILSDDNYYILDVESRKAYTYAEYLDLLKSRLR